jgi:uncharacterized protein YdaU (DUF1376 family)
VSGEITVDEDVKVRGAFWWIDLWRLSSAYNDMTLAEQGAYRNLIDELWLRGGRLPKDDRKLAKICGSPADWPAVRDAILPHFYEAEDGYGHATHDRVASGSARYVESQSRKGKRRASTAKRGSGGRFQSNQPNLPGLDGESSSPASPAPAERSSPAHQPSQPSVAVAVVGAETETETDVRTPPYPPAGGDGRLDGTDRTDCNGPDTDDGEEAVEPIDSGEVLAVIEQELVPKWIAAGGLSDRPWRRRVKGELRARGVSAGRAVILGEIEARKRERWEAADLAARRESSDRAVRMLIGQARASGRDGRAEWAAIMQAITAELNMHSIGQWLRPLIPLGVLTDDEGDRLLVGAPSDPFLDWVQRNYRAALERAADAAGLRGLTVQVLLTPEVL